MVPTFAKALLRARYFNQIPDNLSRALGTIRKRVKPLIRKTGFAMGEGVLDTWCADGTA